MIRESDSIEFDKTRSMNQDLTFIYAEEYFNSNNVSFSDSNKRTLGLIDSDGYYSNTALIISDQCLHCIKCAVYDGTSKLRFKARKEFAGSILRQMDDAYDYLLLNNKLNSSFEGLKRVDHPDYPELALREALINSIVHLDYDFSGSTIINIYDNRIEFVTLGGLIKGITLEDIFAGVSQPRNTVIAAVFYRLELIEAYGTGIQRILECYKPCLEKPEFKPAPTSFVLTLPKMDYQFDALENGTISREELVLNLVKENESVSRKDIELALGTSKFTALQILNSLMVEGKITKSGSARDTRYRLNRLQTES
jgi:ATP-dependent DNA helicase RecG